MFSNKKIVNLLKTNFVSVWIPTRKPLRREEDVKELKAIIKKIPDFNPSSRLAILLDPQGNVIKGFNFAMKGSDKLFFDETENVSPARYQPAPDNPGCTGRAPFFP